jgi:DNA-binding transcriptional MerR regulator
MNIKRVSELVGVSADTIRYYERIGLLPTITRNQSGIRDFTEQEIKVLEFVLCFRKAGVSVESLIDYVSLLEKGEGTERARLEILKEELQGLDSRISELTAARDRLQFKVENYENLISGREKELFE